MLKLFFADTLICSRLAMLDLNMFKYFKEILNGLTQKASSFALLWSEQQVFYLSLVIAFMRSMSPEGTYKNQDE